MSSDTKPERLAVPGQRVLDPGHFVFGFREELRFLDIPDPSKKAR
jgi:hypothetical protein